MPLTPELQILRDTQDDYQGNDQVHLRIAKKTLIMHVAPSQVGKSTNIDTVLELMPNWALGQTETTRPGRPNDPRDYVTDIPLDVMIGYINAGKLVNYTVFETGHVYGTFPGGFPADINLMPTQFRNVPALRKAGFERTETVGLVTEAELWENDFRAADMNDREKHARLKEGIPSIEFMIEGAKDGTVHLVENSREKEGGKLIAAKKVIEIAHRVYPNERQTSKNIARAERMLVTARKMFEELPEAV